MPDLKLDRVAADRDRYNTMSGNNGTGVGTGMIKILYNNCYGGFQFSAEFEAEYKRRTGRDVTRDGGLYRTGAGSIRCDPVAVAIFEEFGSEWSSAPGVCALEIHTIPAVFERYWEVDESDGDESVRVNAMEAYADMLHTFMGTGDQAALVQQYRAVKSAEERYRSTRLQSDDILKPSACSHADTDTHGFCKSDDAAPPTIGHT